MRKTVVLILIGILVLFVVLAQLYAPKTINWMETYEKRDKNPYGDYLLYDFLKDIFPDKKIEIKEKTLYEVLDYYDYSQEDYTYSDTTAPVYEGSTDIPTDENVVQDSLLAAIDTLNIIPDTTSSETEGNEEFQNSQIIPDLQSQSLIDSAALKNYVIINSSFSPGGSDVGALLKFVQEGNCAFIAAQHIGAELADTLNLEIKIGAYEEGFTSEDLQSGPKKDSVYLTLLNEKLSTYDKKYWYRDGTVTGYFSSVDTAHTLILGKNSLGQANYVKVRFGTGYFFLSATPLAYTNYNMMLANNAEYISASLSYLPVRDTYWDEYYKTYRRPDSSKLRFIESQPPLYWAYYIAVWAGLVYIVFESKRRQRVIPVLEPPKNTTVEFVSTIGRLYFQNGNHKDIAAKKIYYFLEYLRTNFYLSTTDFDPAFIEKVSARSGIDKIKVSQLFALIHHLQRANGVSQADLLELNKRLEEFRKESSV